LLAGEPSAATTIRLIQLEPLPPYVVSRWSIVDLLTFQYTEINPVAPTPIPQPDVLVQLRRAQHAVRTRLDADLTSTGLTTPQFTVLATIGREGELSASDLARELGMTAQTVNVMVKSLEKDGLLRRSRHPSHGRVLLAGLTATGRRTLERGRAVGMQVQERVLAGLSTSDRRQLVRLLKAVEKASA
jgi:DNA-binding MarR family transcriptional regulator